MNELVQFSQSGEKIKIGDYFVYLGRKLFEEGNWPHKNEGKGYKAGPEDLQKFVDNFNAPIPLNMDHKPGVIDESKLGSAARIYLDTEAGKSIIRGDVAIAEWLDPALKPETCFSVEINDNTKTIEKVALLLNPQIKDATLNLNAFYAFAQERHDTPQGRQVLQYIHDEAARAGAICRAPDNTNKSKFHSEHELASIQQIHDLAYSSGAKCSSIKPGESPYGGAYFSEEIEMTAEEMENATKKGFLESLKEFFGAGGNHQVTPPAGTVQMAQTPAVDEKTEREKALEKQIEDMRSETFLKNATTFADDLVEKGVILAADKQGVINTHIQYAQDDAERPIKIKFGTDNKEGTRIDAYEATFSNRKAQNFTEDLVKENDNLIVLMGGNDAKDNAWGDSLATSAKSMFGGGK